MASVADAGGVRNSESAEKALLGWGSFLKKTEAGSAWIFRMSIWMLARGRCHPPGEIDDTFAHPGHMIKRLANGLSSWLKCLRCSTRIGYYPAEGTPERMTLNRYLQKFPALQPPLIKVERTGTAATN